MPSFRWCEGYIVGENDSWCVSEDYEWSYKRLIVNKSCFYSIPHWHFLRTLLWSSVEINSNLKLMGVSDLLVWRYICTFKEFISNPSRCRNKNLKEIKSGFHWKNILSLFLFILIADTWVTLRHCCGLPDLPLGWTQENTYFLLWKSDPSVMTFLPPDTHAFCGKCPESLLDSLTENDYSFLVSMLCSYHKPSGKQTFLSSCWGHWHLDFFPMGVKIQYKDWASMRCTKKKNYLGPHW